MTSVAKTAGTVHLVGSVPLPDSEQVFRRLSAELGPFLRRIPDGETGERARWIYFLRTMLENHPAMEVDPTVPPLALYQWDGKLLRETELLRFKAGIDPDSIAFPVGYAEAAEHSYSVFRRLRSEGVIGADVRFLVCLATPMASAYMYISPHAREQYIRSFERALRGSLDAILQTIPHADLALQWDVCQEVLIFEDYFPERPRDYKIQIFDELARLGMAVPDGVELGYHLCYGTPYDEHLIMPRDAGILVEIVNGICARVERSIQFLHIPVPRERTDAAYFEPLRDLRVPEGTALYLGLIHHQDLSGDQKRIDVARRFVSDFGIASECGWGRTAPERLPGLLASHRAAAARMAQA